MTITDYPDWNRQVIVNNTVKTPVQVTVSGVVPPGTYVASPTNALITSASTKIIDHLAFGSGIAEWIITLAGGLESVWLSLGAVAVLGKGIEISSPGAITDTTWSGDVYAIAHTGGFNVGLTVIYAP